MEFDYDRFFREVRRPKRSIRVFEIGGRDNYLLEQLYDTTLNGKNIAYREIHCPSDNEDVTQARLANHQASEEGRDELRLPWDVKDIPYPLPDDFFDEMHCHMINTRFVYSPYSEQRQTRIPRYHLTLDQWIRELARIGTSNAIFFATIQEGYFFGENCFDVDDFGQLLCGLGAELESNGFGIRSIEFFGRAYRVANFTREDLHVDGSILAQKGVPSEDECRRNIEYFAERHKAPPEK